MSMPVIARYLEAIEKNKVLLRETDADVEDFIAWFQPGTRSQQLDHRDASVGIGASLFPVTEVEPQRLGVVDVPLVQEVDDVVSEGRVISRGCLSVAPG